MSEKIDTIVLKTNIGKKALIYIKGAQDVIVEGHIEELSESEDFVKVRDYRTTDWQWHFACNVEIKELFPVKQTPTVASAALEDDPDIPF